MPWVFIETGVTQEGTSGSLAPSSGNPEKEPNARIPIIVTMRLHPTFSKLLPPGPVKADNKALPPLPPPASLKPGMLFMAAGLRAELVMKEDERRMLLLEARYFPEGRNRCLRERRGDAGGTVAAGRQESSWEWGSSVWRSSFLGKTRDFRYIP